MTFWVLKTQATANLPDYYDTALKEMGGKAMAVAALFACAIFLKPFACASSLAKSQQRFQTKSGTFSWSEGSACDNQWAKAQHTDGREPASPLTSWCPKKPPVTVSSPSSRASPTGRGTAWPCHDNGIAYGSLQLNGPKVPQCLPLEVRPRLNRVVLTERYSWQRGNHCPANRPNKPTTP